MGYIFSINDFMDILRMFTVLIHVHQEAYNAHKIQKAMFCGIPCLLPLLIEDMHNWHSNSPPILSWTSQRKLHGQFETDLTYFITLIMKLRRNTILTRMTFFFFEPDSRTNNFYQKVWFLFLPCDINFCSWCEILEEVRDTQEQKDTISCK